MTAYGAAISLKNTIDHILHSSHFTLCRPSQEILGFAYKELQPLQDTLQGLDSTSKSKSRKKVNALDGRIKETLWQLEDSLESLATDQILPQSDVSEAELRRNSNIRRLLGDGEQVERSRRLSSFSIDLLRLKHEVRSFCHALRDMKRDYVHELHNMAEEDEDEDEELQLHSSSSNLQMIGLTDVFDQVKSRLTQGYWCNHLYALVGMAGVGKTALAKRIFEDPGVRSHFECCAWATLGRKPQLARVSQEIEAQLYHDCYVRRLKRKECLIVLDDVWEGHMVDSLLSSIRGIRNGSIQILVTARDRNVIPKLVLSENISRCYYMVRFLDEDESTDLLCTKVFGGKEFCPPELEKAAAKIAKNCEGLPLMIVTVADILVKSQHLDPQYWDDVAEKRNSVFSDAYNQISKVLFPSYDYLPQYLKMPFLYMGVFPQDHETPPSKIISRVAAEGWFLDTKKRESFEASVWKCLDELCVHRTLVLFTKKSISQCRDIHPRMYKTCRLHSSWRYVCREEARKNKFYHVLNRLSDGSVEEDVKGQCCLCLENNILFGIKEFCDIVRLNSASSARSLLFFGPYHQYPISVDVGFRLLRELDALNMRFYTFPTQILTLVQLKYLALTCNGQLPTTISKLFNLRVLIIHPHTYIRYRRAPSYVPIQIWDMQELEHIEILGKSIVAPSHVASLKKFSTLLGVNASICTISNLSKRIPNIRKLGVRIELTPYDDHNDLLSCFGCISTLRSVETLKCSIINPVITKSCDIVLATPGSLMLPRGLKKLHLGGMGFPWEYMDVIGSLPFLQVLKLRSYAFQGSQWTHEGSFLSLEFLLIEDTDLVCLNLGNGRFPILSYLSLKHCYKLDTIQWPSTLIDRKIELVNCNPLALTCAKELALRRHTILDVDAFSSFDKKPTIVKLQRYGD